MKHSDSSCAIAEVEHSLNEFTALIGSYSRIPLAIQNQEAPIWRIPESEREILARSIRGRVDDLVDVTRSVIECALEVCNATRAHDDSYRSLKERMPAELALVADAITCRGDDEQLVERAIQQGREYLAKVGRGKGNRAIDDALEPSDRACKRYERAREDLDRTVHVMMRKHAELSALVSFATGKKMRMRSMAFDFLFDGEKAEDDDSASIEAMQGIEGDGI